MDGRYLRARGRSPQARSRCRRQGVADSRHSHHLVADRKPGKLGTDSNPGRGTADSSRPAALNPRAIWFELRLLWELMHPWPSLATTLAAVLFALALGIRLSDPRLGAITVTVLMTQLSISTLNDWADRERDAR